LPACVRGAALGLESGCKGVRDRVQGAGNLVQGVRRVGLCCSVPATAGLCLRSGGTPACNVPAILVS